MSTTTARVHDAVIKLVPGGEQTLAHLSDAELLRNTRRLASTSNKLFAALLLHLAEVETRGIHRLRSCASLYTYCIYELRMSEDAAARRSSAARLVKAFPALLDAITAGELHLTGLLMLGPHLTAENHLGVLARAKFRTKKEIAKLVRELHPLPAVPDTIEPIGPDLARDSRAPTWEQFIDSLDPLVRSLPEGDRPIDWTNPTAERTKMGESFEPFEPFEPARDAVRGPVDQFEQFAPVEPFKPGEAVATVSPLQPFKPGELVATVSPLQPFKPGEAVATVSPLQPFKPGEPPPNLAAHTAEPPEFTAPARCELPPMTPPQQYRLEFCASEEHVRLVEKAKALLARNAPNASLGELHERAMRLFVLQLEREKFSLTQPSRRAKPQIKSTASMEGAALAETLPLTNLTTRGVPKVNVQVAPSTNLTPTSAPEVNVQVAPSTNLTPTSAPEVNVQVAPSTNLTPTSVPEVNVQVAPSTNLTPTSVPEVSVQAPARVHVEGNAATRTEASACAELSAPTQVNASVMFQANSPPTQSDAPRRRGRNVPATVRREIYLRDGGRCAYVDERGERCRETRYLELHHRTAFARGGAHTADNLTLRCAAHNALAAEEDFGRDVVEGARHATTHESFVSQKRSCACSDPTAHWAAMAPLGIHRTID